MAKTLMFRNYHSHLLSFGLLLLASLLFNSNKALAQMPQCTNQGGFVYMHVGAGIENYNPLLPLGPGNPTPNTITVPGTGLAVSQNINNPTAPSPTFYTTNGGNYWYYDGTVWVNTGHAVGNAAAVNPGAGGGFIYNVVGFGGQIYKYDGTANGTLLIAIPGWGGTYSDGPYDCVADCAGNFYVIQPNSPPPNTMKKFSPAGTLLQTWNLTGTWTPGFAGGGFAIVNNQVVFTNNTGNIYGGTFSTSNPNIVLSPIVGTAPGAGDYASCEIGVASGVQASIDTGYYCPNAAPINITCSGNPPFAWNVISGNAVLTGGGNSVNVTSAGGISVIVVESNDTGTYAVVCNSDSTDTVIIVAPHADINAGAHDTVYGCGTYQDTLQATIINTNPTWLTYNIDWAPVANIVSGGNTLNPIVTLTGPTTFTMTLSTPASQGGCVWTDTVHKEIKNVDVVQDFTYAIKWGCSGDTVVFTNTSQNYTVSRWDFGDGFTSLQTSPTHVYQSQGLYYVKLIVTNGVCTDSITQAIDLQHPLDASFTVDDDSVCQGQLVTFTNTSTTTTRNNINPSYFWDFGDGNTSIDPNPTHTYYLNGTHRVMMVVTDYVPCSDTAYLTVVVDSVPHAVIFGPDGPLCEGEQFVWNADYLKIGNDGFTWDFGDGFTYNNIMPIGHAYDTSGTFTVTFTASYRICPDTTATVQVVVDPSPVIDIGPDTSFCPNSEPLVIKDLVNESNPNAKWLWNTGATTPSIKVTHEGKLSSTVTIGNCSSTDSMTVWKDCYIDIPNAFSPNSDNENDYFLPRQLLSRGATSFKMDIYNRWGEKIYTTNRLDGRGWDGKYGGVDQPTGVYIYVIDVFFKNNTKEHYQGNVTLLR